MTILLYIMVVITVINSSKLMNIELYGYVRYLYDIMFGYLPIT